MREVESLRQPATFVAVVMVVLVFVVRTSDMTDWVPEQLRHRWSGAATEKPEKSGEVKTGETTPSM